MAYCAVESVAISQRNFSNNLTSVIDKLAISHGCLWHMYQFRGGKKNLPIVLPSMVEAENFSDRSRSVIICGIDSCNWAYGTIVILCEHREKKKTFNQI